MSVFWGANRIISIDYLGKGKTIDGAYCANLLQRLNEEIKQKRPHLAKKKMLFHQDDAPTQKSVIAMTKINELKLELLPHAPYSPDLVPRYYFIFPNLKKRLSGQRFSNDKETIPVVNNYFEELASSYYRKGIELIEHRLIKCVELK
ncbi:mariner Mos1 transposase [Trichonephila clavipes]|nr:mariner Mos1 transposase [Trichonephila clavipes]